MHENQVSTLRTICSCVSVKSTNWQGLIDFSIVLHKTIIKKNSALKEGSFKADEDFKERAAGFGDLEYHEQIKLVKDILAAKDKRLNAVVSGHDELTDDELGVINELANHEQSSNWASANAQKEADEERKAKELMAELEKLNKM